MRKIIFLPIILVILSGFLSAKPTFAMGPGEWESQYLPTLSKADKELYECIRGRSCAMNEKAVVEIIEKGANINLVMYQDGEKALAAAACSERFTWIAHYLSSLGADSYGMDESCIKAHTYKQPKEFENKHIYMEITSVDLGGGGGCSYF